MRPHGQVPLKEMKTDWHACLDNKMGFKNLGPTEPPLLVTLNPPCTPRHTKLKWRTRHPVPSVAASKASLELEKNSGQKVARRRRYKFCF
ncbi:uncharacterized protein LOC109832296 isoform X2 [Asparagus officinalis]|uniref:uncharacterized protein LOC109832296 isoform X2 n=1 Tax=Asparagus officinalis TaxID=4686 RepID=UPI00098E1AD5|nr:uncharacterized protein LOC109832296 isoform X2 [Asparagus officinalis]